MSAAVKGEFLGHPKGLFVLFFTELWERFSFYGMKALLILYMLNYLVWNQVSASNVMAWYAGLVYCTPVLGGLLADKLLGARWTVLFGGILIAIGHFLLAFEPLPFFYSGLGFLIAGVGMLKPNISTQVGSLYHPDDARRDSAFTIFYMGINIGALLGPIVCGRLMEHPRFGFHYGFAAAGVGMVIGLIVYVLGMRSVVRRVALVVAESEDSPAAQSETANQGVEPRRETPSHVYRDRIIVLLLIFVFAVIFWMAFEQAANVMTIWADKHTNLYPFRSAAPEVVIEGATETAPAETTSWRDFRVTAPELLTVNPFFIITLAAVFAWFWIWLEKRKLQPSTPAKLVLGFLGMTLAYGVMILAAQSENRPTSAPLAKLPEGVVLEDYGATRLHYDEQSRTLRMNGVLTDLDWLRVLGDSAPESYRQTIDT
ncbi:MAG: peptide MFS transporter, partial [Phycisphaerae bacterium]